MRSNRQERGKQLAERHRRRFERLIGSAMRKLPPEFAHYLDGVAILVADEPSPEQRASLGLADDDVLFGLYEGTPETHRSSSFGMALPDRVTLFRRAFEESGDSEAATIEEIRRTIIHEVAHHWGFEEDQLKF
jgi:predicted Zn-dependent protease with MMP-like domain